MDGFWAALTAWLHKGQLGVIPDWFNGASVLLALYLFLRSRRADDRALVDKVGIWLTTEYERQLPGGRLLSHRPRIGDKSAHAVTGLVRSATSGMLPVDHPGGPVRGAALMLSTAVPTTARWLVERAVGAETDRAAIRRSPQEGPLP